MQVVVGQKVQIVRVEIHLEVQYVATITDDTYFLHSIFCKSPVGKNSYNDNSRDCDSAQFCSKDCDVSDETEWYINLGINGDPINFKIDTGADVTVI